MPRKPREVPPFCACGCGTRVKRPGTVYHRKHMPRGYCGKTPLPRPLCACGCGNPCRSLYARYLGGHVPAEVKAAGGRKGGTVQGYRRRAAMFRRIMDQIPRSMTRQDLLEALDKAYWQGYENGWAIGKASKNLTRQNSQNSTTMSEAHEP